MKVKNYARAFLNEFLLTLTTIAEQKGYSFNPEKLFSGLQVYTLTTPGKFFLFFILVSTIETGFWGISVNWQQKINEATNKMTSGVQIPSDWAVILLKSPQRGFLIPSNDFTQMLSTLYVSGKSKYERILLKEQDLSLKFEFYNWDTFFQILKL